jgi:protein SCO1/2
MTPAEAQTAPPPAPPRPRFSLLTAIALLSTLCIAAAIYLHHPGDGSGFQYYGQWIGKDAPDFTLTDQDGHPATLSSLRGNLVLMTFGFTHCPNICPTTLANLSAIIRTLPAADQQRVRVLFITVDPSRDTPPALKDYVSFYSHGFTGLTGAPDAIARVAKDYGAYYESVMQDSQVASNYYTINHSAYVYLINPQGRFAVLYDNDKLADHTRMSQDIEHVLASPGQ